MITNLTKNFTLQELCESDTARKYGIINQVNDPLQLKALQALCENVLQPLRNAWGKPLHINSGFRCPALNTAVGGTATSQHLKGEAADVACDNPAELAKLAKRLKMPYDQMILYPTFVHFSHKLTGTQRGQVLYNHRYKGDKNI